MNRIVIDLTTGEQTTVPLTPEEVADAQARAAAEAADSERLAYFGALAARDAAKADNVVQYLRDHTPAECEAYVLANVTDLASARALLGKFAIALCVLAKQGLR